MTIDELLNQFYSDLILVKRDSEQTALTYKISSEEEWLDHWNETQLSILTGFEVVINI